MSAVYTSRVTIERLGGGVRRATLPVDPPVVFGVHAEIAEHYNKEPGTYEPHAATLDYVVAAAGG
jgi:hypothetical protein